MTTQKEILDSFINKCDFNKSFKGICPLCSRLKAFAKIERQEAIKECKRMWVLLNKETIFNTTYKTLIMFLKEHYSITDEELI